ncbi:MAG: GNAT family N-acetyltransferase [Proteobacteria bacterium]|nr:GNAT family N-acetyltransferase [Pseudomonadota bacterium]
MTRLRLATQADVQSIAALNRSFHLDYEGFYWDRPEWVQRLVSHGCYFVLEEEGALLAAICLIVEGPEVVLDTIAVKEHLRGQGIGRKLVQWAAGAAAAMGKSRLAVGSFRAYELLDFYVKCGFEHDGIKQCMGHDSHYLHLDLQTPQKQ